MMATEKQTHTPGPWKVEWTEDGELAGIVYAEPRKTPVAQPLDDNSYRKGQIEANAQLIAAAPALLEALEALFEQCETAWGAPFTGRTHRVNERRPLRELGRLVQSALAAARNPQQEA